MVEDSEFEFSDLSFKVLGSGFRVQGSELSFRVEFMT